MYHTKSTQALLADSGDPIQKQPDKRPKSTEETFTVTQNLNKALTDSAT